MGIKRCPSFSKRPGFPCGLRVLLLDDNATQREESQQLLKDCSYEVTSCSSASEAIAWLSGPCSYDVLLADKPSIPNSEEFERVLLAAEGIPCVLMAESPSPEDVMASVKLGVVDFLSKPLAPLKLRNIWQHTVRKMMCNMNINCDDTAAAAAPAVDELAAGTSCLGKPRVSMEVIMEETDDDLAAALHTPAGAAGKPPPAAAAGSPGASSASVINYSSGPNMALAITSSFYEPSKTPCLSLSRCGSSAMTSCNLEQAHSGSPSPNSPTMDRPAKLQVGHHGPVRSCPSSRSLNSAASCMSAWNLGLPSSPSCNGLHKEASDAAGSPTATASDNLLVGEDSTAAGHRMAQRCMRKAVRHPSAAPAAACKPPLAGKPFTGVSQQQHKLGSAPQAPASSGKAGFAAGMPALPVPASLGPLPKGMVWGMPMCPLVRAPGIVPPAAAPPTAGAGMPMMGTSSWSMCNMPMMAAPAFMGPAYGMAAAAYPANAAMAGTNSWLDPYSSQHGSSYQQQAWGRPREQQMAPAAASKGVTMADSTGAADAAAFDASMSAADVLGVGAGAGVVSLDVDDLDCVLGDITAEDDMTDVCGAFLAADDFAVPADLSSEMQALEADMQQQQAAAAAAMAMGRCSFESCAAQRQRVSFDCSTASTCTAARASFEASQRCNSSRVSFEVSARSNRVSFEVNCNTGAARAEAITAGIDQKALKVSMTPAPPQLLGSVSDLFAACSGDSSNDTGLQHVDSCDLLADMHSMFAASGDSEGHQDHYADSRLTSDSPLFLEPLEEFPGVGGLRKNDSFAELINATLPNMVD